MAPGVYTHFQVNTSGPIKTLFSTRRARISTGKTATGAEVKKKVSEEIANESLG